MGFLKVLALLAAFVIVFATVIFVWALSPKQWARVAAVAGVASLIAGVAVYVVAILIALNYYDERSHPAWLTSLVVLALVLAGGGLLAIVSAAVGSARRPARGRP